MAGEFAKEINRESVILNLSLLEKKCNEEDYWLVELVKEELPSATDDLLNYFSVLLEQELNSWFLAPDEPVKTEELFAKLNECAKTLKEYGLNLDKLIISDNGCGYKASELIKKQSMLNTGLLEKLYSSIKKEIKKAEIIIIVKSLTQKNEHLHRVLGEEYLSFDDEDNIPKDKPHFADPQKEIKGHSREEIYQKCEENQKRPEYWKVEVARPELYLNRVPVVVDVGRFNYFNLSDKEKETLKMANGQNTIKEIIENSPMKQEDALNLIVYMGKQGLLGQKRM